jgi:hypothetical protein
VTWLVGRGDAKMLRKEPDMRHETWKATCWVAALAVLLFLISIYVQSYLARVTNGQWFIPEAELPASRMYVEFFPDDDMPKLYAPLHWLDRQVIRPKFWSCKPYEVSHHHPEVRPVSPAPKCVSLLPAGASLAPPRKMTCVASTEPAGPD